MRYFSNDGNSSSLVKWTDELKLVGPPAVAWQLVFSRVFLIVFIFSLVFSAAQALGQGGRWLNERPEKGMPMVPPDRIDDVRPGYIPVLIQYDHQPTQADAKSLSDQRGMLRRQFRIVPAVAAVVPADSLEELRNTPGILSVEIDDMVELHDHAEVRGVTRMGAERVHRASENEGELIPSILGTGVRVAIIDSGIDYNHFDLAENYRGGFDFFNNNSDPWDDRGHGTMVAGSLAARWNGVGVVGVAAEADIYALKVFGQTGGAPWSAIIAALDWCVANNIQVANLSLGSQVEPSATVRQAFQRAHDAGIVLVASAGNNGATDNPEVSFPARFDSVIAVGAVRNISTNMLVEYRAGFSSYGPAIELVAPGTFIRTTEVGNGITQWSPSGTSMAAPHVAGAAALMIQAGIGDWNGDGRINDEVRLLLQLTAEDMLEEGRDDETGYGFVDAYSATLMSYLFGGDDPPSSPPTFEAPTNLMGTADVTGVSLTWQSNSNVEAGFEVQIGVRQGGQTVWEELELTDPGVTSLMTELDDGNYQFRVRAVRNGDVTAWSNVIDLRIGPPSGLDVAISYQNTGRLSRISGRWIQRDLTVQIAVNNDGAPVSNAAVSGRLRNVTTNQSWNFSRTTNHTGIATFVRSNAPLGDYVVELNNVSHPEHDWDGSYDDPGHRR